MRQVTVDVKRLKTTLVANREKHYAQYEKAKAGYIRVTTKQVEDCLTRLTNGELVERAYLPAPPEDHTTDYDDAIAMMDWSLADTIELTQAEFKQYVQDDWGWKEAWLTSNTAYLNQ